MYVLKAEYTLTYVLSTDPEQHKITKTTKGITPEF